MRPLKKEILNQWASKNSKLARSSKFLPMKRVKSPSRHQDSSKGPGTSKNVWTSKKKPNSTSQSNSHPIKLPKNQTQSPTIFLQKRKPSSQFRQNRKKIFSSRKKLKILSLKSKSLQANSKIWQKNQSQTKDQEKYWKLRNQTRAILWLNSVWTSNFWMPTKKWKKWSNLETQGK